MGPMSWFWVILGIVLIGVGLLDLFLSALDYDESGFLTVRLQAMQWRALRSVVRWLPGPWRAFMYAQVIGLQIILSLVVWVVLVIVGFGFVYYGLMYDHTFSFSGGDIGPSMDYAIYYSAAQLSTVGSSGVTPENTLLRALGVVETLIGLGLITLAISFLISIYQTITSLLTLSSDIYYGSPDARDPVSSLAIYFPKGQATGLSDYLGRLYQNLGAYFLGLRLHHTAYYYQSRTTHISIAYTVRMLGGIVAALRWGLPESNPASDDPLVILLGQQFTAFLSYLDKQLQWQIADAPAAQPSEAFARAYESGTVPEDPWLGQFIRLDSGMRQLARPEQTPAAHEAYRRYLEWLPFAYRTQKAVEWIARDLAYNLGTVEPAPQLVNRRRRASQ
jgi:hypothetical protein